MAQNDKQKARARLETLRKNLDSLKTNKAIYQSRADEAQKELSEKYGLNTVDDIFERAQNIDAEIATKSEERDKLIQKAEKLVQEMQSNG